MNSKTLADILSIMRSEPLYNPHGDPALVEANKVLKDYADRIEAAVQREKVEAATKAATEAVNLTNEKWQRDVQRGNGAALYAALDAVRIEMLKRYADIHPQINDVEILELCVNALHRARNCDRFQTASEVSAYWNSNVRTVPLPHDAYGMHIDGETYPTFLDWLMAPAKEGK